MVDDDPAFVRAEAEPSLPQPKPQIREGLIWQGKSAKLGPSCYPPPVKIRPFVRHDAILGIGRNVSLSPATTPCRGSGRGVSARQLTIGEKLHRRYAGET